MLREMFAIFFQRRGHNNLIFALRFAMNDDRIYVGQELPDFSFYLMTGKVGFIKFLYAQRDVRFNKRVPT